MGAKAVNALSEWSEAEVRRDGRVYKMEFERGYATSELQDLGPAPAGQTGTTITFKPDPEIFGELTFDYDTLADRFREIAYLNKGLGIIARRTSATARPRRSASRAASPSTSSS